MVEQAISQNLENLKEAIVKTVAYFDMFDFPLTSWEIWNFLEVHCRLEEVSSILENGISGLENSNGFYYLKNRREIISQRFSRYNFTQRKFQRAMAIIRIFKFIPWIKMIAASNLIGEHNLRDESDIDLFIITKDKRLWATRLFCVAIIKILGLRPSISSVRDKICLSFFISEPALNLSGLRFSESDIYFSYWLAGLRPIYDNNTYIKLIEANGWLKNFLPNWSAAVTSRQRQISDSPTIFYKEIIDLFIGGLEPQFKWLQLMLLPDNLKTLMNQDSRVVISDQILKLHANDRREEYQKLYREKIEKLFKQ